MSEDYRMRVGKFIKNILEEPKIVPDNLSTKNTLLSQENFINRSMDLLTE